MDKKRIQAATDSRPTINRPPTVGRLWVGQHEVLQIPCERDFAGAALITRHLRARAWCKCRSHETNVNRIQLRLKPGAKAHTPHDILLCSLHRKWRRSKPDKRESHFTVSIPSWSGRLSKADLESFSRYLLYGSLLLSKRSSFILYFCNINIASWNNPEKRKTRTTGKGTSCPHRFSNFLYFRKLSRVHSTDPQSPWGTTLRRISAIQVDRLISKDQDFLSSFW